MTLPAAELEHWRARFFSLWTGQAVSLFASSLLAMQETAALAGK